MTRKSAEEIQGEVDKLRHKLERYKVDGLRLADLERQLEDTLYDLSIHQEELSVQNEELLQTREKVESLLARFSVLFDDAPVGYLVLDKHQKILETNQAAAQLLRVRKQRLLGKPMVLYLESSSITPFNHHLRRVFNTGAAKDEIILNPRDGSPIFCMLHSRQICDTDQNQTISLTVVFDITERKRYEQQIAILAERNQRILDAAGEGIVGVDQEGLIIFANRAAEKILGWSDRALMGLVPESVLKPSDSDGNGISKDEHAITLTLKDGSVRTVMDQYFQRYNGERFPVEYVVSPTMEEGKISGLVLTFRDITLRKKTEEALREALELMEQRVRERTHELHQVNNRLRLTAQVFESTSEAIIITDAHNKIVEVNPSFNRITGYDASEAIGQDPGFMKSGRHNRAFYADMWKGIWRDGFWQGEIWDRRKCGEIYPKWLTINTVRDQYNKIRHCIGVFSDISRVKEVEDKLERLAFFDGLTGLPNRTFFKTQLEHEFRSANRRRTKLALLFMDLDNFKNINDTLGHEAGDRLLTIMGQRIRSCVRDSDTVSRLGGDEFTVILTDIDNASNVSYVAQNIRKILQKPVKLNEHQVVVGGSIGIAIYPDDGNRLDTLIKNADTAMYHAKESGRNTFAFFTTKLNTQVMRRLELESGLRQALEKNQFQLHYQPKIDFNSGQVSGMEALIRWEKPDDGLVSPAEFIPIAEESGLIKEIGLQVLEQACFDMQDLIRQDIKPIPCSVNLSTRQLMDKNLIDHIQRVLEMTHLPPHLLELEITESTLADDVESTIAQLTAIREMDIAISIDDFGTGYSSLSYLKRFPINTLKIDRSFVMDLPEDNDDVAIVRAIISMAHSLGLDTVAEGVETEEQGKFLNNHGCQYMQGYFFSRPLPYTDLLRFLTTST
ncbi:sensor domain-containing protein [Magnetococcales bacterium HHB-1]